MASADLMGVSMAKAITIAGVVSVISMGVWLTQGNTVSNEVDFQIQTVPEIRKMISNDADAAAATTANVIASGRLPTSRVSGANITSKWGNITIAAANVTGNANDGFTLAYPAALNTRECNDMVDQVAGFANTISVNGASVKANNAAPVAATKLTQCGTTPAAVVVGYSKAGS